MDSFGSLSNNGGLIGMLQRRFGGAGAAPAMPSDGAMQPTIGPGMTPPAPVAPPVKMGLPQGGILGLLQGQSPQGLLGLLNRALPQAGASLAGALPQAGMMGGVMPPAAAPAPPQLPMNINPMDQF